MLERVTMTQKEISRLQLITKVIEKRETIQQAANYLGLSTRQVKRLVKAFKNEGPEGLISKKSGKPSNHRLPEALKQVVLALIEKKYRDFGPTLAHEYLVEQEGISISLSSIRNLMIEHDLHKTKKKKKQRIHELRARRQQEGELIQVDGSDHEWFEGRAPRCSLLVYIDDATSKIKHMEFAPSDISGGLGRINL